MRIVMCFLLIICGICYADIIPSRGHFVSYEAKIVNLDKFPDTALIGYITGPIFNRDSNGCQLYQIKNNVALHKGYKFNNLQLIAVNKKFLKSVLKKKVSIDSKKTSTFVKCYKGYVNDLNPLVSESVEYRIAGFTASGTLIIYKSKHIKQYPNKKDIVAYKKPSFQYSSNPYGISKQIVYSTLVYDK